MKAIYLSADTRNLERVYGPKQRERISALLGQTPEECSAFPKKTDDIEAIFSTWGMPAPTAEEVRERLPRLKAVFYAAGSVQYFARPFLENGVRVYSAWRANATPVAQFAYAQILLAAKGYFQVQALTRSSREKAKALFSKYPGVYEIRVGILGCGAVGGALCEMLQQTGLEVLAYDPYLSEERALSLGVRRADIAEIFRECLIVSNHIPNLPSTVGVIKREHILSAPPCSTFINTGRGPQLNEGDLYDALTADPSPTALLDVLTDEGQSDANPLTHLPNCFVTPHIAGSSGLEVRRMAEYMADALETYLKGAPCGCEITQKMLETLA